MNIFYYNKESFVRQFDASHSSLVRLINFEEISISSNLSHTLQNNQDIF